MRQRHVVTPVATWILCFMVSVAHEIAPTDDVSIWEHWDQGTSNYQEFITTESERGLFPNIFNLATNSLITSTATCGQYRIEEYCKLVEHVLLRKTTNTQSPQCDICDSNNVHKRHAIEYAIDGTKRWWQSPSLANGLEFEKVNITIDLRQEYQVAYVVLKMGNSPRPGTWVLEKSLDGEHYTPWQYFATQDAECMRQFGIPATTGVPRFQRDDEVHCTSAYSKITPLENGEIHTSLVNGRPGAEKPSGELQRFTRARFVRLRLISPRTLNADLMIINKKSHHIDKSVTMRYFYSISDISIGGQCICYGHAESCPSDPVTGQFKCECRHNTCGESCNKCCPLFNQLPWKPGTNSHPNVCQQCQCFNHADACVYDEELDRQKWSITPEGVFEGGGRCVDCLHHTEGFNCERCKQGFYRPSGMSHYREDACRTCDCDPLGSVSDACVRDDQTASNGQQPGDCICKPGFGGRRCDRCARGYRNHPTCEPCPCNQAGSVNFDTCDGASCQCKANVEGVYCDRCKPGTIHLSATNPLGCQSCFCFGLSTHCSLLPSATTTQIANNTGWTLTDLTGARHVAPDVENGEVLMFNAQQNLDRTLYYWHSPRAFTGNMLNSYGGFLHYYVYYVPPIEHGAMVPVADVVIEGNGIRIEHYSRIEFLPRENMTVTIEMREGSGWYNSLTRQPVDKADLMRALANVQRFMIRAMYQQMQLQSSIFGLSLDTTTTTPDDEGVTRGVEKCECPENFAGNSCESCAKGYRRVDNQLYGGRCEKCECSGHSEECDPFSGECLNCQHNTTGTRCERCLPAHYGNPSLGGDLGACAPCACPTIHNNRSPECMMTQLIVAGPAAANEDLYVCTACEIGYEGNKCEICSDGYFGDPLSDNATCTECQCNNNIDPMDIGNCDRRTGKCLKCTHHTIGDACERCKPNHWGDAIQHTCKACACHPVGAARSQCDTITGECECLANYVGVRCDRCAENHGDVENGCPECDCNPIGSIGEDCDQVSGQCNCKQGVFGKRCDQCLPSYFNFTDSGCQFCHCDMYGSIEGGKCDNVSGSCECRQNVEGTMCEKCVSGFFNISSGEGCEECDCDPIGSQSQSCDLITGQCVCKPGVTGSKCDTCLPNHYGLTSTGCTECDACPAAGQVCDAINGDCVCPPNTIGEMCENCTNHSWDYHPLKGCKQCDCSSIGSDDGTCHQISGQCKCKDGYVGLRCDRCTHGFFNFPTCEPCACDPTGTDPFQCVNGVCLCNDLGECPCKKNVIGAKCDQCPPNSFSLDTSNPTGCFECFCFNRSTECRQSEVFRQQMYADDRRAVFQQPWQFYTKRHNLNLLPHTPSHLHSYPTDATPLYWPLPTIMLGDRTGSYNGFLRFKVWNEDNRRGIHGIRPDSQYFRYFPQVVIVGNHRIELEHIPPEIRENGIYKIRIHESEWRARHSPEIPLTRHQLMIALQNVQGIYIRGSYNYPARGDAINLQEISLDVIATTHTPTNAIGVEECTGCAPGYTGLSCQDPADGYCRKRHRDYLNHPDDMVLIGWAEPCACHGHSQTCHVDTCICHDCQHNTTGDFCERCARGYIGDARDGGADACTKCACPSPHNSFSETCVRVEYGRGYVCDACAPGHTGQYCETCVAGYFGDPQHVGGRCAPCDCHPDGAVHGACDPLSGQCECKPGVTGRDCSTCHERHAFINRVCTSCDHGCYLPLMRSMDQMEQHLGSQNFSNLRPIPWKRVWRHANESHSILVYVSSLDGELVDTKWAKEAFGVLDEVDFQAGRANKSVVSIGQFTKLAEGLILDSQIFHALAFNTTNFLKMFTTQGISTVGGSVLDEMLMESEAHLNATLDRGEYIARRENRAMAEREKSGALLRTVLAHKLNDTIFAELRQRVDTFEQWLDDYRATIYDHAKRRTVDAQRMSEMVEGRIEKYRMVSGEIGEARAAGEENLAYARSLVEKANAEELMNMVEDRQSINATLHTIPDFEAQCQNITISYAQQIDELDAELVQPAQQHTNELAKTAHAIGDSFAHTRLVAESPLEASHAYEEIIDALRNASRASKSASDLLSGVEKPHAENVRRVLEQSEAIAGDARMALEKWAQDGLENEKQQLVERLAYVNEQKIDMVKRLGVIKNEASSWDDKHDRMHSVLTNGARSAHDRATNVKKVAEEIGAAVAHIATNTHKLQNSTSGEIRHDIEKIRKVREQLEYDRRKLARVDGATQENRQRANEIAQSITLLRDRIEQAREASQQIRLSLSSGERGLCRRSFISPATPSPVTKFHVTYRPLQRVADAAILITKTKSRRTQSSEYLALEIRDRRVVAHWDIGAGVRMVTNSHAIHYIPPNDRATWYHIDVERAGNAVNLTVALRENVDGGLRPRGTPVSVLVGESLADHVVFNTVPGESTIQVGVDNETAAQIGLATNKFYGVIGGLRVDGVAMPLWAFDSSSGECEGANAPPRIAKRGYRFRDGFANISMSISERTMSAITVIFNTYSANGLLYFRGSEETGDHVALYLKNGRVVFQIHLGSTSTAELISQNAYNDGGEHTVKAIRTGSEIYLQVDSDADRFSTVIPGENTVLNIANEHHYVGGVPPNLHLSPFSHHIEWRGFVGCILMVKPSQVGELDLEHPAHSQRRDEGCEFRGGKLVAFDCAIGFRRPGGFFTTSGLVIDNNSSIGFAFNTHDENGTLLYQSSRFGGSDLTRGFMAFYMFRGYLVLNFGKDASSRQNVVTFRTTNSYNDGQTHYVYMTRVGEMIRLKIDDREIGESQRVADESAIASDTLIIGGFGGKHVAPPSDEIPFTTPFIGCISNVLVNWRRVELIPSEHSAQIGWCAENGAPGVAVLDPLDGEMMVHRKTSKIRIDRDFYNVDEYKQHQSAWRDGVNGVRYGISKSSHSRLNFVAPYPNVTTFTISLALRTQKPNGMIWAWANYKNYTRYMFLNIIDGFATFEVKGHKHPKILKHLGRRINDNQWHDVVIEKRDKILRLKIDELPAVQMSDCPTPKVMRRRVYVGGVISKHRSQFAIATPGFDGCVRQFTINGEVHALDAPDRSRDVVGCAAKPTKAMYCHHGGYVAFESLREMGADRTIDISLEFHATIDNGTILALVANSNADLVRVTIEIRDEQVLFTMIHAQSDLEIRDALPALRSFTDSKWHSIHLMFEKQSAIIELDGEHHQIPLPSFDDTILENLMNVPVNIGGMSAQIAEKLGTASLAGCYRALHVSGNARFFENALKKNKVLIDACPMH